MQPNSRRGAGAVKEQRDHNGHAVLMAPRTASPSALCQGVCPLAARLADWMWPWLTEPQSLSRLIQHHGSPLHLHHPALLETNAAALRAVAMAVGIELRIFFARKANKALCYVEQAQQCGIGLDVASGNELQQALEIGIDVADVVYTAAVKEPHALHLAVRRGVTVVIDNHDEWQQWSSAAGACPTGEATWALRLRGFDFDGHIHRSRFGVDIDQAAALVDAIHCGAAAKSRLRGLHFHLDSHSAAHRAAALRQSIALALQLRRQDHPIEFIDVGGGFPVQYLQDPRQWPQFLETVDQQLLQRTARPRVLADGFSLGRSVQGDRVVQSGYLYPYGHAQDAGDSLAEILRSDDGHGGTIAKSLIDHELRLHCEPGRSLVDGCGMTIAEVAFRKRDQNGDWLIGLQMNRTHCSTTAADFCVDPIVLAVGNGPRCEPGHGYFVGSYCTESEYITPRRMHFPGGIAVADLIVFPNTAGYQMHFLESRSHQFALPKNVVATI